MFDSIYNQIYFLGLQTIRYGKRFFKWLFELMLRPLKALGTFLLTVLIIIDKFALKTFHEFVDDFRALAAQTKRVSADLAGISAEKSKSRTATLVRYAGVALQRYKRVFVYVLNIALPIASLAVLISVVNAWSATTFALEINYNGDVIGYVRNEAVYKEAREQAIDRLDLSASSSGSSDENSASGRALIGNAEYRLTTVKRSQLNDSMTICDKLIEKSDSEITNACGIYIDDNFICAVKNETDALSVFEGLLAEYETDEENAVVGFVENIEYVQGLYPDNENTVWDAERLSQKLNSKKSEALYYTVQAGDTVSKIAQRYNMSSADVFNLNPELRENIFVGQKVLLSGEVSYVRVQVTKTEQKTVDVPFETIKVNTDSLYEGDKRTVTKGVKGLDEITELVTFVDGVRVSSKEISRVTVREPVAEKIQVGTKKHSGGSGPVTNYGGQLLWPTVGANSISSYYGARSYGGWHNGIDIVRPGGSTGVPIVAAESGKVIRASYDSISGYCVIIQHSNGLQTLYAHMKAGTMCVSVGQYVSRGQRIGNIGGTGNVTGPHLHFEVRVNGNRVNPAPYLGIKSYSNYR